MLFFLFVNVLRVRNVYILHMFVCMGNEKPRRNQWAA